MDTSRVTRLEVIDDMGRHVVRYDVHVTAVMQDDDRTLKIFVTERED